MPSWPFQQTTRTTTVAVPSTSKPAVSHAVSKDSTTINSSPLSVSPTTGSSQPAPVPRTPQRTTPSQTTPTPTWNEAHAAACWNRGSLMATPAQTGPMVLPVVNTDATTNVNDLVLPWKDESTRATLVECMRRLDAKAEEAEAMPSPDTVKEEETSMWSPRWASAGSSATKAATMSSNPLLSLFQMMLSLPIRILSMALWMLFPVFALFLAAGRMATRTVTAVWNLLFLPVLQLLFGLVVPEYDPTQASVKATTPVRKSRHEEMEPVPDLSSPLLQQPNHNSLQADTAVVNAPLAVDCLQVLSSCVAGQQAMLSLSKEDEECSPVDAWNTWLQQQQQVEAAPEATTAGSTRHTRQELLQWMQQLSARETHWLLQCLQDLNRLQLTTGSSDETLILLADSTLTREEWTARVEQQQSWYQLQRVKLLHEQRIEEYSRKALEAALEARRLHQLDQKTKQKKGKTAVSDRVRQQLHRKKLFEQQVAASYDKILNIDEMIHRMESAQSNVEVVKTMEATAAALRDLRQDGMESTGPDANMEERLSRIDEIAVSLQEAREVDDALAVGFETLTIEEDDDELLRLLEEEMAEEEQADMVGSGKETVEETPGTDVVDKVAAASTVETPISTLDSKSPSNEKERKGEPVVT